MKSLNALLLLAGLLIIKNGFCQSVTHLQLSDQYPAAGEKITFIYDPSGTPVGGKTDLTAAAYFLDDKDYPVADIDLKPDGKLLKGEITIPSAAKAFFIKISSDDIVDNNNGNGYLYLVYKGKRPSEGAYAADAHVLTDDGLLGYYSTIKRDYSQGLALFKKEFQLYPQSENKYRENYYLLIAGNQDYTTLVNEKIDALEKSNNENDQLLASKLLRAAKKNKAADSVDAITRTKFPSGALVRDELHLAFLKEDNLAKKDSLYNIYIKKYPENTPENENLRDNFKTHLAEAYLKKGDINNYLKYESQVTDKSNLPRYLNSTAWNWALAGKHLDDAEKISKQSLDLMTGIINKPKSEPYTSPRQAKTSNQQDYDRYADTYAFILLKENKAEEALKYQQGVYERSKNSDADVNEHYVLILAAAGQYAKAQEVAANSIRVGKSSDVLKEELKKDYVKVKGNDNGYDLYFAAIEQESKINARKELAKKMINQPAPVFTLKDLNGKMVSLTDFKGKIVVAAFWTSGCSHCRASFPGMQMAVNKYKDDPGVKFLFIDCWENADNYLDVVKKFIADNKYTFNVLMDEKGEDGEQTKVKNIYGAAGVPTKFVIDKNGFIRFKYMGYKGTPEGLVEDITNMIEMAANPDSIISNQMSLKK